MKVPGFLFKNFTFVLVLYVLLAVVASSQSYLLKEKKVPGIQSPNSKYNNYLIFKYSYFHLVEGKNLYQPYSHEEHSDLYKYSPTFAFFFGIFACFPDWFGLTLWNLFNVLVFILAIKTLPGFDLKKQLFILVLCAVDAMTSLQNSQSNLLMAGLLILGFGLFEKQKYFLAVFCIAATLFIKIFGVIALIIFLFYPEKWKVILYSVLWFLLLGLLPLPVIGPEHFISSYSQYVNLLFADHSMSLGISVLGVMKTWFNLEFSKILIPFTGFMIMCIPLIRLRAYSFYNFRLYFFTGLLIWMVIFNHKAESPTFIIATSAIFIWFLSGKQTISNIILVCLTFLFTTLSSTDIFPAYVRMTCFVPYHLKVIPCILVWVKIQVDLMLIKNRQPVGIC